MSKQHEVPFTFCPKCGAKARWTRSSDGEGSTYLDLDECLNCGANVTVDEQAVNRII